MKDSSSSMETRGKARHDRSHNKNGILNQEDHRVRAKRLRKASGEEVTKRSKKVDDDLKDPLSGPEGDHHNERDRKKSDRTEEPHQKKSDRKKRKDEKPEEEKPVEEKEEEEVVVDLHKKDADDSRMATSEDLAKFLQELEKNVTVEELKTFLGENSLDSSGMDEQMIYERSADALMFGPCTNCPTCGGVLQYAGQVYRCMGYISEWSRCNYSSREHHVRRAEKCKLPSQQNKFLKKWVESHEPVSRALIPDDKFLSGLTMVLVGRMGRSHGEMKSVIENYGGTVTSAVRPGVSAILSSKNEMSGGGSSRTADAAEMGIPICREDWLEDCIEKAEALPLQAYNMAGELVGRGDEIPWDQRPPEEEAIVALKAELKLVGKRGVYSDTNLQEQRGKIYESNGIIYNCALSMCDITVNINQYAILQLIEVDGVKTDDGEGQKFYLYFKEGRVGDLRSNQERLDLQSSPEAAVQEFENLFEEVTGNQFEEWESEKVVEKKRGKYFPVDMAPGVDARAGGLGVRQLGVAASHCDLDARVVEFLKLLFSQAVYRFALSEMGLDAPDLPTGILTDWHIDYCKKILEEFAEFLKGEEKDATKKANICLDFSNKWFTLLHTTRPVVIENFNQLSELGAATLECVRDISYASRLLGDLSGDTLDDPITKCYGEMGCEMIPLERDGDDYKMIGNYFTKTMDPLSESDGDYTCVIEDIVMLKSKAAPSPEEMAQMPNKVLLWSGMRTSNLVACLSKGMLPAVFYAPGVPGYCFGRGIYCTDAACKAAKYGFTAVDRADGFLLLSVVSLGEEVLELSAPVKDVTEYEQCGKSIKVLGKRTPNKQEYFKWKKDVTVPCGNLMDTSVDGATLDYNEYVVYNPKQVILSFLLRTRFEGMVVTKE